MKFAGIVNGVLGYGEVRKNILNISNKTTQKQIKRLAAQNSHVLLHSKTPIYYPNPNNRYLLFQDFKVRIAK
jgi:hypothetical protein